MFDRKEISKKTKEYLLSDGLRTPLFYMLPKIHKNLQNPPGRGIESCNSCPTEKISQLSDIIMNEFVKLLPSYIKDTTDFLQKHSKSKTSPQVPSLSLGM